MSIRRRAWPSPAWQMLMRSPRLSVVVFSVAALGAALGLRLAGAPPALTTIEFPALLVASILAATLEVRRSSAGELDTMAPYFVVDFATLLLLGTPAAMLVAAAGELAHALAQGAASRRQAGRVAIGVVTAVGAIQAAGAAYLALDGSIRDFSWPWEAGPLAGAVLAYCVVRGIVAGVVWPLVARRRLERAWARRFGQVVPPHVIGASLSAGLAEASVHGDWKLLPVAAIPVYFAYRGYVRYLDVIDEERRRGEVLDSRFVQGLSAVDQNGDVVLWSDALERLAGVPRRRAIGRPLLSAMPGLASSPLEQALQEVLQTRAPRTIPRLALPGVAGVRFLEVRLLPADGGATLLWQDVTERTREDGVIRRTEERLALAAEAANDGLWEWDLKTQECFFSGRWRAMVGLPAQAGLGRSSDWITRVHPEDVASFKEALKAHLAGRTDRLQHEHRLRHEDGTYRWFLCRGVALREAGRMAGSLTEGALARERMVSTGYLDPLTGLANRTVFVERLGRRLADAKARPAGERFAVLYLDLDRFKVVNDSLGHMVGDELLTAVSRRLESCLRPTDVLARLGGDEFAILLNSLGDDQQANAVAFRIQESLSAPFAIAGREVFTTASIGIALGLTDYETPDELMRDADTAMYHAKTRGKARHELFDADMHARVRDRLGLESDLRHAVVNQSFEVHYQPIVALATGRCVGFESLIRWNRKGHPVSPATFIPLAEELGLIEPVGTWVLRQACRTFAEWQQRYSVGLDYVTVNVSSRQLVQQGFLSVVERAVHDAGLRPSHLRLEITETALMDSPKAVAGLLSELRDFGVKIYLDDFGTGYSSLSHLHRLPVDALKIDRAFVNSLLAADRPAIVESILALARTLNTSVVAEGIETADQARELERLGCTHAQGYLFSKPLASKAAEELLAANQPLGPKRATPVEREVYGASSPFKWPEFIAVRGDSPERRSPAQARA